MAELLGEVDSNITAGRSAPVKTVKSEARRKIRVLSPPPAERRAKRQRSSAPSGRQLPNTPPAESTFDDDDDGFMQVGDVGGQADEPQLPSSPAPKATEAKAQHPSSEDEDDEMEVAPAVGHANMASASVNISGSRPPPAAVKAKPLYPTPRSSSPVAPPSDTVVVDASSWNEVTNNLNVLSTSTATEASAFGKLNAKDVLEPDGSLRMFWIDYTEVNGNLCLFGKVKDRSTGGYASCFVKVDNILRKLYILPRSHRFSKTSCPGMPFVVVLIAVQGMGGRLRRPSRWKMSRMRLMK
jgi:DNA polymerase alpha subunit A